MNLCRCERGHFYDKEKYATCPHCAGGSASDDKLTEAFTSDVTVPMEGDFPKPSVSQPASFPNADPAPFPTPVPIQTPPPAPAVTPIAPQSMLPVAGMEASQVTVPLGNLNMDGPTVPLDYNQEEDSDNTVGFFDDAFLPTAGAEKKAPAQRQTVNKVSTPCVGWLVALSGEHIGTDFRLKVGKNFIGRNSQMDIALTDDKSVSRDRHAIVVYEPKAHLYLVQPGESSSLVYCNNDVVLTPVKLSAYDMITVGDVNLLFIPLCGERFSWGALFEEMKKKEM